MFPVPNANALMHTHSQTAPCMRVCSSGHYWSRANLFPPASHKMYSRHDHGHTKRRTAAQTQSYTHMRAAASKFVAKNHIYSFFFCVAFVRSKVWLSYTPQPRYADDRTERDDRERVAGAESGSVMVILFRWRVACACDQTPAPDRFSPLNTRSCACQQIKTQRTHMPAELSSNWPTIIGFNRAGATGAPSADSHRWEPATADLG